MQKSGIPKMRHYVGFSQIGSVFVAFLHLKVIIILVNYDNSKCE